jgi:hypothetical protein
VAVSLDTTIHPRILESCWTGRFENREWESVHEERRASVPEPP